MDGIVDARWPSASEERLVGLVERGEVDVVGESMDEGLCLRSTAVKNCCSDG